MRRMPSRQRQGREKEPDPSLIARQFEEIAKEYEALAQMFKKMAKGGLKSSGNSSQK